MSEYQYYEFRAIDRPLSREEQKAVAGLSSRATVNSHSATFVYNYGDFRGDEKKLMTEYFDVMLYIANWGSRELMFRIPIALIDLKQIRHFSIDDSVDWWKSPDEAYLIFDIRFDEIDSGEWLDGEGVLNNLVDLRSELIQGDYRVLYLAWLKSTKFYHPEDDNDEPLREPPVPPGLALLTEAQKKFVEFMEINHFMIEAAAEQSEPLASVAIDPGIWIPQLPEAEKDSLLIRLMRGDTTVVAVLDKRIRELSSPKQELEDKKQKRRKLSTIKKQAKALREEYKAKREAAAALERKKQFEALALQQDSLWEKIKTLIEEKKTASYDEAFNHLKKLCELAKYQGTLDSFRSRIDKISQSHRNRPGLLRRLGELPLDGE